MNRWNNLLTKVAPYFLILLFTLFLFRSFFSESYFMGHDSLYHISSTEAIITSLKSGNFNLDILPTVAYDFGYGSGMFYSQIFHLCSALFFFLTGDLIFAIKLTHILIYFLTGCAFYVFLKNLTKNPSASLLGSFFYLSAPYHLADHLVRDAETEVMIFLFIPLILNSLFHLIEHHECRFLPLFVLGYSGLFLSNSAIAIFFTIFLLLCLLLNHKITFRKEFFLPFLKATLLTILIIAPYYLNIIQQRAAADYVVFSERTTSNNYYYLSTNTTSFDQLFSLTTSDDYLFIPHMLNLISVLGAVLYVIKYFSRRRAAPPATTPFFTITSILLVLCSLIFILPIFPWDLLPAFLTPLQFPWRLETILLPALITLTVFYLSEIKPRPLHYSALAFCIVSCFYYPTLIQHNFTLDYSASAYPPAYYGLGWGNEYLPEKASRTISSETSGNETLALASRPTTPIVTSGFATISNIESHTPHLSFTVSNLTSNTTIELPRLYYLGYKITTKSGQFIPYEESQNGLIQIKISSPGTITVEYANTNLIKISRIFPTLALCYLAYFALLKNKLTKNQD